MSVRVQHIDLTASSSTVLQYDEGYRLDLALTPRPCTRVSFVDHWTPHRFENAGRIFVLPPGQGAKLNADAGFSSAIVCHVVPKLCAEWLEDAPEWTERRLEAGIDVSNPRVSTLLLQIAEEVRSPGFASEMLLQAYGVELAINLHRHFLAVEDGPVAGGLSPWRLRTIDERLRDVAQAPTLVELAALCKLSVRQLSRGFRASRGISIGDHVANTRLDEARRRLVRGESVKAVAFATGFKSPSSFCYAFRKATGCSPKQYLARATL